MLPGRHGGDPASFVLARSELSSPGTADGVGAVNASNEPVPLHEIRGEYHTQATRMGFEGGRTEILAVSETARELVLYADGEEVDRFPIDLVPNTVNELRR